jgi:hypothetical protein
MEIKRVTVQPAQQLAMEATGIDLHGGATTTRTVGAAVVLAPALTMMNPPLLMPSPKSLFDGMNTSVG